MKCKFYHILPAAGALLVSAGLMLSQTPQGPPGELPPGTFLVEAAPPPMMRMAQQRPMITQIVRFETEAVNRLNAASRDPQLLQDAAQRKIIITFDQKLGPGWFDRRAVVIRNPSPQFIRDPRVIQQIRDTLMQQVDAAVVMEYRGEPGGRAMGSARVGSDVIDGKLNRLAQ